MASSRRSTTPGRGRASSSASRRRESAGFGSLTTIGQSLYPRPAHLLARPPGGPRTRGAPGFLPPLAVEPEGDAALGRADGRSWALGLPYAGPMVSRPWVVR